MATPAPTVRGLARALGLAPSTVSDALRGTGRVNPATMQRVRRAARDAGYRRNPLAASLMSELRHSRGSTFRGVLAIVEIDEPDRSPHGPFHRELVIGARAGAHALGYSIESFVLGARRGVSTSRLDTILQSRGIHGVLLLPAWHAPDLAALDWSRYAAVYTDNLIERPVLHAVSSDHYRSMLALLATLAARGYRRPGLYLDPGRDERVQHRHSAALHAFQHFHAGTEVIPPLLAPEHSPEDFIPWFRAHQPDVVLSHFTDVLDWMTAAGSRVPDHRGFVCLNLLNKTRPCAGLDLLPRELGTRAVEVLIAQLHRNERGVPASPMTTTLAARFVDGPTLRA